MNFTTPYSFEYDPKKHAAAQSELASETKPDMAYTVRELLERFTTNSIPPIQQNVDGEEETFDDAYQFDVDLTDVEINRRKQFKLKQELKDAEAATRAKKAKQKSAELEAQQKELVALREAQALATNS